MLKTKGDYAKLCDMTLSTITRRIAEKEIIPTRKTLREIKDLPTNEFDIALAYAINNKLDYVELINTVDYPPAKRKRGRPSSLPFVKLTK